MFTSSVCTAPGRPAFGRGARLRFTVSSGACAVVAAALAAASADRASAAIVTTLSAGAGENLSTIQIDFTNGNGYLVEYRWELPTSSFSALVQLDALLPDFTLDFDDTVFGPLVTGIGVLGDYEYGNGDQWPVVENYWHFWVKDTGDWSWAPLGAADRVLFDGSFDAWVFGSPATPQAVPGPAGLLMVCGVGIVAKRRRQQRD